MLSIYALITFWLPIITAVSLSIKAFLAIRKMFRSTKTAISEWANALLDNHMTHIQAAVEDASKSIGQMAESNRELVTTMKEMRTDFQQSYRENDRKQTVILTSLEVLKDR